MNGATKLFVIFIRYPQLRLFDSGSLSGSKKRGYEVIDPDPDSDPDKTIEMHLSLTIQIIFAIMNRAGK